MGSAAAVANGWSKKEKSNMLVHFWMEEAIGTDGKHDVNVEKPQPCSDWFTSTVLDSDITNNQLLNKYSISLLAFSLN